MWQDIARRRPTERCVRILRGGGNREVWPVIARRRPTEMCGRIVRGGQQKCVVGYCEEEANRKVWQDIARRRPTEMCGRIIVFVFTLASTENYKLELCS